MRAATAQERGGAPVASIASVTPAEALLIRCLRNWCDGDDGRGRAWADLVRALGPAEARRCLSAFERLCRLLLSHGRRPLMCHRAECSCIGSDEAVFANFVMTAADGTAEDAQMIASLMFDLRAVEEAWACARTVGSALIDSDGVGRVAPAYSVATH